MEFKQDFNGQYDIFMLNSANCCNGSTYENDSIPNNVSQAISPPGK